MKDNASLLEKAGETFGYLQQYVEKKLELYRLEVTERIVVTLSSLITSFLVLAIIGMVVLFGSLAVGFYLADALGSLGLAFLIVTLFYGLLAVALYIFRRDLIMNPILQMILSNLREEDED